MKEAQERCPVCKAGLSPTARYCGGCGYAVAPTATNYDESDESAPSLVGQEVAGRYRIIGKLGEGGMGAVYRAQQISLKREIALKVLKPELSARPGLVRRFNAEAELAAKLNHPNTVTLYDFGQAQDGSLFIAMEFIAGRSLRDLLVKEGPQPTARIAAIGSQICASLADAHGTGIVHRDLKPDNVMLSERGKKVDVVTVLDFGIAKLRDEEGNITQQPMTRAGDMLGTPQYMAPEQIRGERVDARTDIYALGVILYELATARLPFDARSIMALLSMHLTEPPIPPHQRRPDLRIDSNLELLIMRCLAKSPNERPASMDAVEDALENISALAGPPQQLGLGRSHSPMPGQAGNGQPFAGQPGTGQPFAGQPGSGHPTPANTPGTPLPRSSTPSATGPDLSFSASAASTPPRQRAPQPGPARKSRAWLWVSLALLLAGGVGASIYVIVAAEKPSQEEEESNAADDFMKNWASESPANPVEADELEDLVADGLTGLGESGDDPEAVLSRPGEFQYQGAERFTDPTSQYVVDLPATFTFTESDEGAARFSGYLNAHKTDILTAVWPLEDGLSDEQLQDNLKMLAPGAGLDILSIDQKKSGGHTTFWGRLRTLDGKSQGDFIMQRRKSRVFFAAIGSAPGNYKSDKKYRQTFLQFHFHPMAD